MKRSLGGLVVVLLAAVLTTPAGAAEGDGRRSSDLDGDGADELVIAYDRSTPNNPWWTTVWTIDHEVSPPGPVPTWNSDPSLGEGTPGYRAGSWDHARTKWVSGDFDGDGLGQVLAIYADWGGSTSIWQAHGATSRSLLWQSTPGQWEWERSRAFAADVDADGIDDLAVFYDYGGGHARLWIWSGSPSGLHGPFLAWDPGPANFYLDKALIVAADTDGDRADELVLMYDYSAPGSPRAGLWRIARSASGAWTPIRVGQNDHLDPVWGFDVERTRLVAADVNGDGHDDLAALYDSPHRQTLLWVFDGAAVAGGPYFSPQLAWITFAGMFETSRSTLVSGDFDGDGDGDVDVFYDLSAGGWPYDARSSRIWRFAGSPAGVVGPPALVVPLPDLSGFIPDLVDVT